MLAGLAQAADETTNREVLQTFVNYYISQKQFDIAEKKLVEHLQEDPQDGERWNVLGMVYFELKKYAEADNAFAQAVRAGNDESRGVFLYNQANVLNRSNQPERAIKLLKEASQYSNIHANALDALERLEPGKDFPEIKLEKAGKWTGSIGVQGGYDTNVLLLSQGTLDTIESAGTASSTYLANSQAAYKKEYYHGTLDANGSMSYNAYTTGAAARFNALNSSLGFKWTPEPGSSALILAGSSKFNISFLNTNGMEFFSWNEALALENIYIHTENFRSQFDFIIKYQKFSTSTTTDSTNDRTGIAAGIKYANKYSWRVNTFSLGLEFERAFASGQNFKSYALSLPISFTRKIFWKLSATAGIKGGLVWYPDSATSRRDSNLNPTFSLSKPLSQRLMALFNYGYIRNMSNVSSASYDKHTFLAGIDYGFY